MSETMIDQVARAMVAADSGPEGSALFDIHWHEFGAGYLKSAGAAIKAMRKPTEAMHEAGAKIVSNQDNSPDKPLPTLRNAYCAMIDAALTEATSKT